MDSVCGGGGEVGLNDRLLISANRSCLTPSGCSNLWYVPKEKEKKKIRNWQQKFDPCVSLHLEKNRLARPFPAISVQEREFDCRSDKKTNRDVELTFLGGARLVETVSTIPSLFENELFF